MYSSENYVSSISTADYIAKYRDVDKFIVFCQQCNKYNNCWACPPFGFDKEEYIMKYKNAYIIGTKITLSEEIRLSCKNNEDSKSTGVKIIEEVRKNLDKQLLQAESETLNSRAFFAGTCHFCPKEDCTRIVGKPCRYPDKIRPSLESLGFDIGKTTEELLGIKLQWSTDGSPPEYLVLVSGLFTNGILKYPERHFMLK
ncbi:DUF2284 domain-containing protein [Dysgonomonas sp. Marseille-P4677]|uniref:DUF2284 domain-containing protein n=1 Tax=Dysgonomonas sp. Marseille-P4677 TaxID=2364790 RepID=UPI0019145291|nr:DUF2284 domain-containing protein [Dysgonomonas sp. Marseille-P4677]MBK5722935.1 DUF2284 domain-containing protein [Dysgonomonas sp. Marseille-P4677]